MLFDILNSRILVVSRHDDIQIRFVTFGWFRIRLIWEGQWDWLRVSWYSISVLWMICFLVVVPLMFEMVVSETKSWRICEVFLVYIRHICLQLKSLVRSVCVVCAISSSVRFRGSNDIALSCVCLYWYWPLVRHIISWVRSVLVCAWFCRVGVLCISSLTATYATDVSNSVIAHVISSSFSPIECIRSTNVILWVWSQLILLLGCSG